MDQPSQMERFRLHLVNQGMKLTKQREAIAAAFFDGEKHLSLSEILELSRQRQAGIGYATVYRTMRLMSEGGLATEHRFGDGETQYEASLEGEHHDHLICERCDKVIEFEDHQIELLQEAVARDHGFRISSHRHEIYGVCSSCLETDRDGTAGGLAPTNEMS